MKKAVIGLLLLVIIAGAVMLLYVYPNRQFNKALDKSLAKLKDNKALKIESISYQSAGYCLLGGRAEVKGLAVRISPESRRQEYLEYNVESIKGSGVPLKTAIKLMQGDDNPFLQGFKAFRKLELKNTRWRFSNNEFAVVSTLQSRTIKGLAFKPSNSLPDLIREPIKLLHWLPTHLQYDSSEDQGRETSFSNRDNIKVIFKVARFNSSGYENLKLGRMAVKDLSLNVDWPNQELMERYEELSCLDFPWQFTLGELSAGDLDASWLDVYLKSAVDNDPHAPLQEIEDANILLPKFGHGLIEVGPLEARVAHKPLVTMKKFKSVGLVTLGRFPNRISSSLTDLTFNWSALPLSMYDSDIKHMLKAFNGMGYDNITLNAVFELLYSEAAKSVELKQYTLDVADMFKLDFNFQLSEFNPGTVDDDYASSIQGLASLNLDGLRITLTDQGLSPRLITYLGRQRPWQDEVFFINDVLNTLDMATPKVGYDIENAVPVMAEIKALVSKPHRISLHSGITGPLNLFSATGANTPSPNRFIALLRPVLTVNNRPPVEIIIKQSSADRDDDNYYE